MNEALLEKHQALMLEIAHLYLDNMQIELGKKYKNKRHQVNAGLSNQQYKKIRKKYGISYNKFANVYGEFQRIKSTRHLEQVLDAFTASGGNIDIEPSYDENTRRMTVSTYYTIKNKVFEKIEGLTPLEDVMLKMNAMLEMETILSDSDA